MMRPRAAFGDRRVIAVHRGCDGLLECFRSAIGSSMRRVGGDRSAVHDGRRQNRARSRPEGRQSRRDGDPELERAQARRGE